MALAILPYACSPRVDHGRGSNQGCIAFLQVIGLLPKKIGSSSQIANVFACRRS